MSCEKMDQCNNVSNHIKETVARIDKVQKEVLSDAFTTCVSCETSLFASSNTIPVRFNTCCGNAVIGNVGTTATETVYFRIEALRCNRFVTLRLLVPDGDTLVGTDYTMILDLDCVGTMQCFEAINVDVCTQSTAA